MSTKVQLAKEPKLLMRLIGLLSSGVGKSNEKITKLAALTLNNIAMAPASRMYMLPFEKDLFIVASSDESVSKLLGDILGELDTYEIETNNIWIYICILNFKKLIYVFFFNFFDFLNKKVNIYSKKIIKLFLILIF